MLKKLFLISLLMLFMTACFEDCNPVGPDDPFEPEPDRYYDFIIEYHRPAGSIIDPDRSDPWAVLVDEIFSTGQNRNLYDIDLVKKNECLFVGEFEHVVCRPSYDTKRVFDFSVGDRKRETSSSPTLCVRFGDTFILENKQTGVRKKLNSVIRYQRGCEGTMARCYILYDGSVVDY